MEKKRLTVEELSVQSFVTDEVSPVEGTVFGHQDFAAFGEAAPPTEIEVCTKNPNYTCDGSRTCSGIETCDGDRSCPLGCDPVPIYTAECGA
jgi:hypothetical protein